MKLSEKLRLLREEKGKTQEEAAHELGFGIQTLRNYESDKLERTPNTKQLIDLKNYYNVTYEYLLDDECENRTKKTVDIGKELKLSDKSIKNIKNLNDNGLTTSLNLLLEKFDSIYFFMDIEELKKLKEISNILNNYILSNELDNLSNVIKKIESIYNNLNELIKKFFSNESIKNIKQALKSDNKELINKNLFLLEYQINMIIEFQLFTITDNFKEYINLS